MAFPLTDAEHGAFLQCPNGPANSAMVQRWEIRRRAAAVVPPRYSAADFPGLATLVRKENTARLFFETFQDEFILAVADGRVGDWAAAVRAGLVLIERVPQVYDGGPSTA